MGVFEGGEGECGGGVGFGIIQNYRLQCVTLRYVRQHSSCVHFIPSRPLPPPSIPAGYRYRKHHRKATLSTTNNHHRPIHDCAAEDALRRPPPCGRKLDASAILYVGMRRPLAFVLGEAVPVPLDLGDASPFDI